MWDDHDHEKWSHPRDAVRGKGCLCGFAVREIRLHGIQQLDRDVGLSFAACPFAISVRRKRRRQIHERDVESVRPVLELRDSGGII